MRRLKRGDLDSILNEFIQSSAPWAKVEYKGVEPKYLKQQLTRKIKERNMENISLKFISDVILLEHNERSRKTEGNILNLNIPIIRRSFKGK